MKIELIEDIENEPVSLAELKAFMKVTGSAHDSILQAMNTSARVYLEKATGLSFAPKTLKVTSDYKLEEWELPYGPVNEITDEEEGDDYTYTYTTGYDDLPDDLKLGIKMTVKHWYDIDDIAAEVPNAVKKIVQINQETPIL